MSYVLNQNEESVYSTCEMVLSKKQKNGESLTSELIFEKILSVEKIHELELSDEERIRIQRNLEEDFVHSYQVDEGYELNDQSIPPWVPASKPASEWPFWFRYRTLLQRDPYRTAQDLQLLDEHTDRILEQCGNPKGESLDPERAHPDKWDIRGMVFGNVQMGKTSNYSGLICKAADAGYKVIIVLSGVHENLRIQTQERIDEAFIGKQSVGSPKDASFTPVGVGNIRVPGLNHPPPVLWGTTRIKGGDFRTKTAQQFGVTVDPSLPPIVMVVKKNSTVLRSLLRWLVPHDQLKEKKKRTLEERLPPLPRTFAPKECPLLVIDDESDQASVDTASGGIDDADGKAETDHDPKVINRLIRSLLRCFPRSTYVGYTATPFANILIHEDLETSQYGQDLFPANFIRCLHIPRAYVGPTMIFGARNVLDEEYGEDENPGLPELIELVYDHAIPPNDVKTKEGWMPPVHRKTHYVSSPLPQSLKNAITDFTLAGAGLVCRGRGHLHQSMLIHVTRFQNVLNLLHGIVCEYWDEWSMSVGNGAPEVLELLKKRWESSFAKSFKAVRKQRGWEQGLNEISWDDLITTDEKVGYSPLQAAVKGVEVRQVHGGPQAQPLDYRQAGQLKVIAIGGGKLSRGLTLENLTTSYFLRTSRMYDTLTQMGRWFGYRPCYLDLCRLYMTEELHSWFSHMSDASMELREELERMQGQGSKPREFGLRVRSHPVMQVTSSVKMRYGVKMRLGFSDSRPESISFSTLPHILQKNWDQLAGFIRKLEARYPVTFNYAQKQGEKDKRYLGWKWERVFAKDIISFLEGLHTVETATVAHSERIANYIKAMSQRGELTEWTVFLRNKDKDGVKKDVISESIRPGRANRGRRPVETRPKYRGQAYNSFSIGSLIDGGYEALDLSPEEYQQALKSKQTSSVRYSDTKAPGDYVRRIRPAHRGLLLLYTVQPIDSKTNELEEVNIALKPDLPLVGFAISFPSSQQQGNEQTIEYVVNNVYDKIANDEGLIEEEEDD